MSSDAACSTGLEYLSTVIPIPALNGMAMLTHSETTKSAVEATEIASHAIIPSEMSSVQPKQLP